MSRIAMLVDTPNVFYASLNRHGKAARPDYWRLRRFADTLGQVVLAEAFVNDGVPEPFARYLEHVGYRVVRPHAMDVDHALVARAVAASRTFDLLVLATGDRHFAGLVRLLRATGVETLIAAVPESTSRALVQEARGFVEFPVIQPLVIQPSLPVAPPATGVSL